MNHADHMGHSHGWLDRLAIGMAAVCAVHCLLTPILIVALPIIATTFFVHKDFHLWMLFLVIPTTTFSIFMGCRRHKDRIVMILAAVGMSLLVFALIQERSAQASPQLAHVESHVCPHCVGAASTESSSVGPLQSIVWINTLGGLFLAGGHYRNYRICRKDACMHD